MQSLTDYIKIYSVLDKDICSIILSKLENETLWSRHEWTNSNYKVVEDLKNDDLYVIEDWSNEHTDYLMKSVYGTLVKYFTELNMPEFNRWQGYTPLRFNRYSEGQTMHKHVDNINSIFEGSRRGSPLLSVVGLLNSNFTGGDFIMFDNYKVKLNTGDIMIFPSSFTYPHTVTPVSKGTRYSFVSWVW